MLKSNGLKYIFLGLIVAAFTCLGMCGVTLRTEFSRLGTGTATPSTRAKKSPWPLPSANYKTYVGKWMGAALLPNQNYCNLLFEMTERAEAIGQFSGYATFTCFPFAPLVQHGKLDIPTLIRQRTPQSAILVSRGVENGALVFEVKKLLGGGTCPLTAFSITPFGESELAADWKNGTCSDGQLLLGRTR
jgi:hypothetical protein